jgi:hypothetical protein
MAVHGEAVLRLRVCLGNECRTVFFLCSHCDRGNAIAAWPAAIKPGSSSGDAPIAGTSRAPRDDSIIATGSVSIGSGGANEQPTRA